MTGTGPDPGCSGWVAVETGAPFVRGLQAQPCHEGPENRQRPPPRGQQHPGRRPRPSHRAQGEPRVEHVGTRSNHEPWTREGLVAGPCSRPGLHSTERPSHDADAAGPVAPPRGPRPCPRTKPFSSVSNLSRPHDALRSCAHRRRRAQRAVADEQAPLRAPGARPSVRAPTLARRGPRPRSRAAASARECSRCSSGGGRVAACRDGRWVAHGRRGALGPLPERLRLDGVHASTVSPLGEKSRSSEGQSCLPGPGAHPPPTPAPDCTRRPPLRQRLPSPDAASHGHSRGSRVLSARPLLPTMADDSVRPRSAETATEQQAGLAGSETQTSSRAGGCACG